MTETIDFYAALKKVERSADTEEMLTRLGLDSYAERDVGELSGGLKQRLALALALLADPPMLVLDEPTANLDIRARDDFLQLLLSLKAAGKTLLFSSHRLEEVMVLADRVMLMEGGSLIFQAPPGEILQRLGRQNMLHLYVEAEEVAAANKALSDHGLTVFPNGRGIRVQVDADKKAEAMRILHDAGVPVIDFVVE